MLAVLLNLLQKQAAVKREKFMNPNFWNKVYTEKSENETSWFQEHPLKSLDLIKELNLPQDASIIDVGGGDSRLVDHLLAEGFKDISVLDISEVSLNKLRARLGASEVRVKYIVSDVTTFHPTEFYDLWHDRATFHFLTELQQIEKYLEVISNSLRPGGNLIISTFSKNGPEKCSGLPVHQYSEVELKELFKTHFENTKCFEDVHTTPWGTTQSFVYCGFKRKVS